LYLNKTPNSKWNDYDFIENKYDIRKRHNKCIGDDWASNYSRADEYEDDDEADFA
jgi:hypothetical protein